MTLRHRTLLVLAVLALAACSGGASSVLSVAAARATPASAASPTASTSNASSTMLYGMEALKNAHVTGAARAGSVAIDVALRLQNAAELAAYAKAVSDPKSGSYRKFLTPAEIGARFGASPSDLATVAAYFESYGLHVGTWPQHLSVSVSGSQRSLERALGTTLDTYAAQTTTFLGPAAIPHFARPLPVVAVTRLITAKRSFRTIVPTSGGAVTTSGYSPQQIRNGFDYTGAYAAGFTGSGVTVGIVGTGPISASDVPAYGTLFSTAVAPVSQVDVTDAGVAAPGLENPPDTSFQTPPPVTATCSGTLPTCNPEDVEAQLDTEQVASLAPGSNVLFYLGYTTGYCIDNNGNITPVPCASGTTPYPLIGLDVSDDEIQQAIADDRVDVLSLSYGGPEQANAGYEFDATAPTMGLGPSEFAALAAEGVAVFASSGDSGAEGCQGSEYAPDLDDPCVSYPATDPNVTSVGGVNAPFTTFGVLTNQITGWGYATDEGDGGSGGGVSLYFPQSLTPWQENIPGIMGSMRNEPDASLLGDPKTGAAVLVNSAFTEQVGAVGGTSVAAPEMAAMWALVLQACARNPACATASGPKPYRLGNAAPLLYAQYATGPTILPTYGQTFYDVLYGDNQQSVASPTPSSPPLDSGFNAGPGYDRVTGLGVPFGRALVKAVAKQ
jgi:subtilase family serine protease